VKCTVCHKDNLELRDGQFVRNGYVMGSIPKHDFKCSDCLRSIDHISREPGCDDEPIPGPNW